MTCMSNSKNRSRAMYQNLEVELEAINNVKPQIYKILWALEKNRIPLFAVGICTYAWEPCLVSRPGEPFLQSSVCHNNGGCSQFSCCLSTLCPLNKTSKDYADERLFGDEKQWLEENAATIVRRCRSRWRACKETDCTFLLNFEFPPFDCDFDR
jgi:hypothetical protein